MKIVITGEYQHKGIRRKVSLSAPIKGRTILMNNLLDPDRVIVQPGDLVYEDLGSYREVLAVEVYTPETPTELLGEGFGWQAYRGDRGGILVRRVEWASNLFEPLFEGCDRDYLPAGLESSLGCNREYVTLAKDGQSLFFEKFLGEGCGRKTKRVTM